MMLSLILITIIIAHYLYFDIKNRLIPNLFFFLFFISGLSIKFLELYDWDLNMVIFFFEDCVFFF